MNSSREKEKNGNENLNSIITNFKKYLKKIQQFKSKRMAEIIVTGQMVTQLFLAAELGEAIVITQTAATTAGLFGMSFGATICIGLVGVLAIAGVTYLIIKKIRKSNSDSLTNLQTNIQNQKRLFKCPKLPEHDQISSFSQAFTISSEEVKQLEEAYSCSICLRLMVDPVIGLCCRIRNYERVVIQAWVDQNGNCPFCRKTITKTDLMANDALKKGIKVFRKQLAKRAQRMNEKRIEEDGLN